METALWINILATFPSENQAVATVKVWVELDGGAVPVTRDSNEDGVFIDPDDGRVVFNNRDFELDTNLLAPGAFLDLFLRSRSANAFNWVALNVGSGLHTVTVKVQLTTEVAGSGEALAGIGKRLLLIEPAKLAKDAAF